MKLQCPECGSFSLTFGRDYIQYRYWMQEDGVDTYFYDFEYGDDSAEDEECKISCCCSKCNHIWELPPSDSIDNYLDG